MDAIVVDPDSRLTQLGIVPCCDDSRYYFFESRAFGGSSDLSLPMLTANWLEEVFGIEAASPYVAPGKVDNIADVCVSWGVGENDNKRLSDDFEADALAALLEKGDTVLLDRGAGGDEATRADELQRKLNSSAAETTHRKLRILRQPYRSKPPICRLRFCWSARCFRRANPAHFGIWRVSLRTDDAALASGRFGRDRDPFRREQSRSGDCRYSGGH